MSCHVEQRVTELVEQLTLDEKAALTAGSDLWRTTAVERLGLMSAKMTDGPVGARGDLTSGTTATAFPCGSALGATWDPSLVREVGNALALEARSKGAHILLGPTANLHRYPLAGRNFECFSEDPELAGSLAAAWVEGVQDGGVGAALKHLVCNDQEHDRMSISVDVDDVTLREIYLRPFEMAVAARPWMVMAAYNRLNGIWCTEHHDLLTRILKQEWGFDGVVVSDWWATHSVGAAAAGLDLEMPGPGRFLGGALADAVRDGELDEAILDDQARRILRLLVRAGRVGGASEEPERSLDSPTQRRIARRAATSGMVLLINDGILPLLLDAKRVALIGPAAVQGFAQGGGSAAVLPHRVVGVEEGLRAALPEGADVLVSRGVPLGRYAPPIHPDLLADGIWAAEFWPGAPDGPAVHRRTYREVRFSRLGFVEPSVPEIRKATIRFSTTLTPDQSGLWEFWLTAGGEATLTVDGHPVIHHAETGAGYLCPADRLPTYRERIRLERGVPVHIVAELRSDTDVGSPRLYLGAAAPDPMEEVRAAARLAASADVAVVVVGTGEDYETESSDRVDLTLPGSQNRLVEAVLDAQPNTVVVVNAGAPLELGWSQRVRALLWAWFPGQELGHAVADVLTGKVDPGGRLPCAFPVALADTAASSNYPGSGGAVRYAEGTFIGQRHHDATGVPPAWPLGHGLSYTTFLLGAPVVTLAQDCGLSVRVPLRNTGQRGGTDVVQLYAHRDGASDEPRRLIGFARASLLPGEETELLIDCPPRAFARWHPDTGTWYVPGGRYTVEVARSATDVAYRFALDVPGEPQPAV